VLREAIDAFYAVLDRYTLADLVNNRSSSHACCSSTARTIARAHSVAAPHERSNASPTRAAGTAAAIVQALESVVDPEVAMNIVDVGLVYGVDGGRRPPGRGPDHDLRRLPGDRHHRRGRGERAGRALPPDLKIHVELVWEPPWTPQRMSAKARSFMGW
jgi:metal-sulfur cluster biosynthetic enzyme